VKIAIIGSREMSEYGKRMVGWIISNLEGREVEIVSIGVRGCNEEVERKARAKGIKIEMLRGINFEELNYKLAREAEVLIIVEGGEKSGTMLVARNFVEENKEVWVIPGRVGDVNSWVPHFLIKNGAGLLGSQEDFDLIFDK